MTIQEVVAEANRIGVSYGDYVLNHMKQEHKAAESLEKTDSKKRDKKLYLKPPEDVINMVPQNKALIYQYTADGKTLLNKYSTTKEAAKVCGVNAQAMRIFLRKENGGYYHGYYWEKSEKPSVCVYTLNYKLITEFETIEKASEAMDVDYKLICSCLSHKSKYSGGYVWRYKGDRIMRPETDVHQYDEDGTYIQSWVNCHAAEVALGYIHGTVSRAISTGSLTKGCYWTRGME